MVNKPADRSTDRLTDKPTDYKNAGVDIHTGEALVDWLQSEEISRSKNPQTKNVISGIGGFSALFRFNHKQYAKPVLVSSTDGVGTKVKLASHYKKFEGIGQDLVAMCANDLITCGAEPLFFLDYYAVGKLELTEAKAFLKSVRKACDDIECALVGGETAEMPGVYQVGDFDCAGFIVGAVDEDKMLGAHLVKKSDIVLGVSSSGFHSNGYSLLRKVFAEDLDDWAHELLKPTALYHKLIKNLNNQNLIKSVAHITGGGVHNIPRVVPQGLGVRLKKWSWPEAFQEVQRRTKMSDEKMLETLNCGVGLALIVAPENAAMAKKTIESLGYGAFDLGHLEETQGESKIL